MRSLLVMTLLLGACVADSDDTTPTVTIHDDLDEAEPTDNTAICNAAAALPAEDPCALVCDPDGFKARLTGDGMEGGACYQLRCALTADLSVTVGVCLP